MHRKVFPELLDSLPPDSPEAVRSRRDLVRLNRIMNNYGWFRETLTGASCSGENILELGAGDGGLAKELHQSGLNVAALDQVPAPPTWSSKVKWYSMDMLDFQDWADYPRVVGNLILHHFNDADLLRLGACFNQHARVLLFNEPLRSWKTLIIWRLGAPLGGACRITRHDGAVSIRAGFHGDELPILLGLSPDLWRWQISTTVLGAYRFTAQRR